MRPDATVESDHAYLDRIGSTQSHALVVTAPLASGTTQNDPNRTDRSASQNSDRTCFRRLLRLVEFASTSAPCADPQCRTVVVNVDAAGLNVRTAPNGYPVMSLVNGTPLIPLHHPRSRQ